MNNLKTELNSKLSSKLSTEVKAILITYPFAQLLASSNNHDEFSALVYCPIQLLENSTLLGHLPNNNPLIKAISVNPKVKVIFTGPHGYISPRWHSEQLVPTWNYATVTLTCRVNSIDNTEDKLKAMEKMSHHFDPQWDFSEFNNVNNAKMVQQMLSAITVFTLDVIGVNSKFKLSQNRSAACRSAFQQNLIATGHVDLGKIQQASQ